MHRTIVPSDLKAPAMTTGHQLGLSSCLPVGFTLAGRRADATTIRDAHGGARAHRRDFPVDGGTLMPGLHSYRTPAPRLSKKARGRAQQVRKPRRKR